MWKCRLWLNCLCSSFNANVCSCLLGSQSVPACSPPSSSVDFNAKRQELWFCFATSKIPKNRVELLKTVLRASKETSLHRKVSALVDPVLKISNLQLPPLHSHCNNHKQMNDYRLSFESYRGPQTLCRGGFFFTAQSPPWTLELSSDLAKNRFPFTLPPTARATREGRSGGGGCRDMPADVQGADTNVRLHHTSEGQTQQAASWEMFGALRGLFRPPAPVRLLNRVSAKRLGSECRSAALIRRRFFHTRWQSWEDGWKKIERPFQLREVLRLMRLFALHWHIFCTSSSCVCLDRGLLVSQGF